MDFWNRLIGFADPPKKPAAKPNLLHDPQARLDRFRRVYNGVLELCNRPRNATNEGPLLNSLHAYLDRIATLLREESRAPGVHLCVQFAGGNQIYALISRAAPLTQHEPVIRSAVAVFAALVDSEEEDFLASGHFAKSMMKMIQKVLDSDTIPIGSDTETSILELLFTVTARIRLQPEILPVWFHSTVKPELEDVFVKEKKSFVGITQKDDFPLCYLLMDRVHREGRTGDFARTGLLYVFEATGRSLELEHWVVSSDLPTLMASGLGALYSQLSRELSILHPDATLPAVLAMSDYSTTHPRATAESAFSEEHRANMATFLLYLAFWQDVLDHCRSEDVKQTLLDHFQILFLQQLLYPSLLQSSDIDAGSSVAVLTYMSSMLEFLDYPDLIHMMLTYLLAVQGDHRPNLLAPETPAKPSDPPRSPTSVKRRKCLMLISAPADPDGAVDPNLFNLVDLITNNISSHNSQAVFASLKLTSAIISRQKQYAFGPLLKVEKSKPSATKRTTGAFELEATKYSELAVSLHRQYDVETPYRSLCEDLRQSVETQASPPPATSGLDYDGLDTHINSYLLGGGDTLVRSMRRLLRTFFTNSVDVNLALTDAITSIARCAEIRLDNWLALPASTYIFENQSTPPNREWQANLDNDEASAWSAVRAAAQQPVWSDETAPFMYMELKALSAQLGAVRNQVSNLDLLIGARTNMLQAGNPDIHTSESHNAMSSPIQNQFLDVPQALAMQSRSSSKSSLARERTETDEAPYTGSSPHSINSSASVSRTASSRRSAGDKTHQRPSPSSPPSNSFYKPPPPEMPSTTDVLMQTIEFQGDSVIVIEARSARKAAPEGHAATLNHVLTNAVVLQQFVLELIAVLQVRAAVFGQYEVRNT